MPIGDEIHSEATEAFLTDMWILTVNRSNNQWMNIRRQNSSSELRFFSKFGIGVLVEHYHEALDGVFYSTVIRVQ
jgi:hypothetical protein